MKVLSALRAGVVLVGCLLVGVATPPAYTQNAPWAQKIFLGVTNHDFGTVPHGAQLKHRLLMKNIYAVPLQITEIRSSCGCLTWKPSTNVLKPKEEGYIDLTMDTSRFSGPKSVTLFVTVGPQYVSTAMIPVTALIRNDVVFNPGSVDFGTVTGGSSPMKIIDVEYAGVLNWQIIEIVKSKTAPFSVTAQQTFRQPPGLLLKTGKVGYQLQLTLDQNAPAGFFRQELYLKTNDPNSPMLTVYVEGNVQSGGLKVSHESVKFDTVKVGTKVTRKVIVSGAQPFRIVGIDNIGNGITADWPVEPAVSHFVNVHCEPTQAGDINRTLILHTDTGKSDDLTIQVQAAAVP